MFLLFILLFFIYQINATTIGIIMVTSPKKRPELQRTLKDLAIALSNQPTNITVTDILLLKGCINDCHHLDLQDSLHLYHSLFPNISISSPHFSPFETDGTQKESWTFDALSSLWNSIRQPDWSYSTYQKYLIVNFYFLNGLQYLYQNTTVDYFLMLEDDQTFDKHLFTELNELIQENNPRRLFSKIAWCQLSWCIHVGDRRFTIDGRKDGVWGAWGAFRSRNEIKMFLKWLKFSRMSESEDTLAERLNHDLETQVEVKHISHHFGRDNDIPQ